ncbi:MAG: DUF1824 family protein [Microcystaceae cyanobacterium]
MSDSTLNLQTALKLLHSFSLPSVKPMKSDAEKEELRQAIRLVVSRSEWENLGICADTASQAIASLNSYLKALEYEPITVTEEILPKELGNAVYLKYNSQKNTYYLDNYTGNYRGVLISCQGENDQITGTFGHFPLDLYF